MPFLFVTTVGIFYHLPYFRVTVKLRNLVTEPVNGRAGASSIQVQLTPHIAMASLGYSQDCTPVGIQHVCQPPNV